MTRKARFVAAAFVGAVVLAGAGARAQAPGDEVRIELDSGAVEGALVDKLPNGYLVRVAGKNQVVPYTKVRSIAKIAPAAAAAPSAAPTAAPSAAPEAAPAAPSASTPPAPPPPAVAPSAPPPPPAATTPAPAWTQPIPPPAPPPPPPKERRNTTLATAGSVLTGFGIVGVVAGIVLIPVGSIMKSDHTCHDPGSTMTFDCEYGSGGTMLTAGIISVVAGGVLLAGGIPMMAIGSQRVEKAQSSHRAVARRSTAPLAWSF